MWDNGEGRIPWEPPTPRRQAPPAPVWERELLSCVLAGAILTLTGAAVIGFWERIIRPAFVPSSSDPGASGS